MPDNIGQQLEEAEVLLSIYDGDENFRQVNPTTYHYKFVEGANSFILEVMWGPDYPTEKPIINVDLIYNQFIQESVKIKIMDLINYEAEQCLGCAMTYTLFERLKDRIGDLMAEQVELENSDDDENAGQATKKPTNKREQITKAQKRRACGFHRVNIVKNSLWERQHPPVSLET